MKAHIVLPVCQSILSKIGILLLTFRISNPLFTLPHHTIYIKIKKKRREKRKTFLLMLQEEEKRVSLLLMLKGLLCQVSFKTLAIFSC